ncbi:Kelch repeat-containing protein [Brumimicrobium aurantiacum]|uniref:T9SS C-terminal target domain-containing protein n=1 Tax=Brumimicrobium aurantiacum TaxID=1737063 RepID=A0A3E1F0A1_9FLAO|nr:kelch repeat-containing protein [Brumimicrobium aurantiacum]RFC55230.1 T9SS C-terminal target domain-containing protein [Brumimicrobium aurantiacum]
MKTPIHKTTFINSVQVAQLLLLYLSFNFSFLLNAQSWQQLDDFPATERDDGVSFVIGDKAYCGTGYKTGWVETKDFHVLDMNTDQWSTVSSLPIGEERQYASAFASSTKGFVFGGIKDGDHLNDLWKYNSSQDSWTEMTPLPAEGRRGSVSFVINGVAYIVGGNTEIENAIDEVWAYNINDDTWEQKNDFPFGGLYRASGTSSENYGYLIFGQNESNNLNNKLYAYDPISDSWTLKSTFPETGRMHSSLNLISNQLFVIAGIDDMDVYHKDLWRFDLSDSTWHELVEIPGNVRKGGMAFNNGDNLYYTTGINDQDVRLKESWKCVQPLSLDKKELSLNLSIYPNPANETLILACNNFNLVSNNEITITNSIGKLVTKVKMNSALTLLDISHYSKGVFFVSIQNENIHQTIKFIKK